jgi:hypothetical protein
MTSAERARLVMTLRQEIDAKRGAGSPGAVRKVLKGLGTPEEVVRRAAASPPPAPAAPARSAPAPSVPVPRKEADEPSVYTPGAAPETLEWWRKSSAGAAAGGGSAAGPADRRPPSGWSASFEPDFLTAGEVEEAEPDEAEDPDAGAAPVEPLTAPAAEPEPAPERVKVRRGLPPLVESLAVLVLAAAGVLGLWYLALFGWFLAYSSRRVGRAVALTAGVWIPVALAALLAFWVERSGHPGTATVHAAFALWLRAASLASAVFLLWRARR